MQRLQRKDCPMGREFRALECRAKKGNDRVEPRMVSLGTIRDTLDDMWERHIL